MLGVSLKLQQTSRRFNQVRFPFLPTGTRFAVLGDSRTQNSFSAGGTFLENGKYADRVLSGTRGKLNILPADDFGVGGDTTTDMVARIGAVAASAARVVLFFGGTNDRGSANMTLAQTQANVNTILDTLLAAGKLVVMLAEIQRFTPSDLAGQQLTNHINFHNWILGYRRPGVLIADAWDAVLSSEYIDGLHPLAQGQWKIGNAFATALTPYLDPVDILPLASGNLLTNSVMAGTAGSKTGSATGNVADSWTLARGGTNTGTLTVAGSKVTSGGKTWQQVDITGTPTGTHTDEFRQDVTLAAAGLVVGDTVEAFCEFAIDTATSFPGLPFRLRGFQVDGSTATFTCEHSDFDSSHATAFMAPGPWTGVYRIQPTVIPALTNSLRVSVVPQTIAGAATLTARFTNISLRKAV